MLTLRSHSRIQLGTRNSTGIKIDLEMACLLNYCYRSFPSQMRSYQQQLLREKSEVKPQGLLMVRVNEEQVCWWRLELLKLSQISILYLLKLVMSCMRVLYFKFMQCCSIVTLPYVNMARRTECRFGVAWTHEYFISSLKSSPVKSPSSYIQHLFLSVVRKGVVPISARRISFSPIRSCNTSTHVFRRNGCSVRHAWQAGRSQESLEKCRDELFHSIPT